MEMVAVIKLMKVNIGREIQKMRSLETTPTILSVNQHLQHFLTFIASGNEFSLQVANSMYTFIMSKEVGAFVHFGFFNSSNYENCTIISPQYITSYA